MTYDSRGDTYLVLAARLDCVLVPSLGILAALTFCGLHVQLACRRPAPRCRLRDVLQCLPFGFALPLLSLTRPCGLCLPSWGGHGAQHSAHMGTGAVLGITVQ